MIVDIETVSLIARINAILATARLSAWQRSFLSDIQARLTRYGSNTHLSEKQRRKLEEIIGGNTSMNIIPFARPKQAKSPLRWQRQKSSFIEREGRWWTRRLLPVCGLRHIAGLMDGT